MLEETLIKFTRLPILFFKINHSVDFPEMFAREVEGLNALREGMRTPFVLDQGEYEELQFLELELINGGMKDLKFWISFGQELAQLHKISNEQFGFEKNNYIGSLRQSNNYKDKWEDFLIEERIQPQLEMAVNAGEINYVESKPFEHFYKRIAEIYPNEPPALLHGDLWGGNYICAENGDPVLIDPAVYYGHREIDLGMMHLFGGFDTRLYDEYQTVYPLEKNWRQRIEINQLYPLLVHVNLFGRSYWSRVKGIIDQFMP